jgi:hypothetical protein
VETTCLRRRGIAIKPLLSLIKTSFRKEQEGGEKDNFHNLIFGIDKMVAPGIFRSTTLMKLPLSKGGDGWEKDLRNAIVVVA